MPHTRILVVEDSKFFSTVICRPLAERLDAKVVPAYSLAETKAAVAASDKPFNLALVDLVLPDAPDGETVGWLQSQGIPCVVFTSLFSEDLRERFLAQHVIDYVVKDTPSSLDYLLGLVEQIHRNLQIKALVVDDSRTGRKYTADLLRSYQFKVIEAEHGRAGLARLEAEPDIKLVVTDYHMPEMDGVEMVRQMRRTHHQDRLAIIGISSGGGSALSAKFIKFGANDFLIRPFLREEFFCRVMQNMRLLDTVEQLRDAAIRDVLTGIHNRRFFFDAGETLMASAQRDKLTLTAAMVDIDFFKKVNDTHGHDGGDVVLKRIAALLRRECRQTDIVARLGGEEFAILSVNMAPEAAVPFFNKIRKAIEVETIEHAGKRIPVTASFGLCHGGGRSLEDMLKIADDALYRAKRNGRNQVELVVA